MNSKKMKTLLGVLAMVVCWIVSSALTLYAPAWISESLSVQEFGVQHWLRFVLLIVGEVLLSVLILSLCAGLYKLHSVGYRHNAKTKMGMIAASAMATEWLMVLGVTCGMLWAFPVVLTDVLLCVSAGLLLVLRPSSWNLKKQQMELNEIHRGAARIYTTVLIICSAVMMWSVSALMLLAELWYLRYVCLLTYVAGVYVTGTAWMNMSEIPLNPEEKPEE